MSDHLPDTLMRTLSSHLELGKSRLQTLSWSIIGVINARTVNLSHVASPCSGSAQVSSNYRRLQRFFQHVRLDGDWLAVAVVKLMKIRPPWVLRLDRTNWKIGRRDVNILMLAVATRRLRIPLMWTVLDNTKETLADRMPVRRQQNPGPEHGRYPPHTARQTQHPAGYHHPGHGLGLCLARSAIKGTKAIQTRTHGYRYKSWFRLGFDQLGKWILHPPERAAEIWRRIWPKRKSTFQTARVVSCVRLLQNPTTSQQINPLWVFHGRLYRCNANML